MPCYNRDYDLRRVLEAYDQQDTGIPFELIIVDGASTDDSLRQQGGFVDKALQWSRQQETLYMVDNQINKPIWVRMLAKITSYYLPAAGITFLPWFAECKGCITFLGSFCRPPETGCKILDIEHTTRFLGVANYSLFKHIFNLTTGLVECSSSGSFTAQK